MNAAIFTQIRRIVWIALATVGILLLPLVAMQFSDEVVWTLSDFIIAAALLFGTGFVYELVSRRGSMSAYRGAVAFALLGALGLVWVNGAVGIIGSEDNPANLLYGAVIGMLVIGSMIARLKPRGMARALFATAIIQLLVPVFALLVWPAKVSWGDAGVIGVFVFNSIFAVLFIDSAALFRGAARGTKDGAG